MSRKDIKKILNVFRPSSPTTDSEYFVGREHEIYEIGRAVLAPSRHVLVYGERGVGKTSLVSYAAQSFSEHDDLELLYYRCESKDSLETIFNKLLKYLNKNTHIVSSEVTTETNRNFKGKAVIFESDSKKFRKNSQKLEPVIPQELPSVDEIATQIKDAKVIYHIDEFDLIINQLTKSRISELIKTLSDYNSKLKIIFSGVANSASDIFSSHKSTIRNITTLQVPRMSKNEINIIIMIGEESLSLSFSENLKNAIVNISRGLPYFTHLICEELAMFAYEKDIQKLKITDLYAVIKKASNQISGTIASSYENATVDTKFFIGYGYEDDPPKQPQATSTKLRKLILHSIALENSGNYVNIANLANKFLDEKDEIDEADVEIILEEMYEIDDNLFKESNGVISLKNPFCEAFMLTQATSLYGKKVINLISKKI